MSYNTIISENTQWIDSVWKKLDKKLSVTSLKSRDKIPYTTQNGIHDNRAEGERITSWTNGFWGGLMWLMYAGTGKEEYKTTAKKAEKIMDNAFNYVHRLHHSRIPCHVSQFNQSLLHLQHVCACIALFQNGVRKPGQYEHHQHYHTQHPGNNLYLIHVIFLLFRSFHCIRRTCMKKVPGNRKIFPGNKSNR